MHTIMRFLLPPCCVPLFFVLCSIKEVEKKYGCRTCCLQLLFCFQRISTSNPSPNNIALQVFFGLKKWQYKHLPIIFVISFYGKNSWFIVFSAHILYSQAPKWGKQCWCKTGDFRGFYYKNIYISTNLKQKSPGRAEKVVVHLHHLHPLVRRHCLYLLFEITLLLCTHFWSQV